MDWWSVTCCNTKWPVVRQFQTWIILWVLLIIISIFAVIETTNDCKKYVVDMWYHKVEECDIEGPVLLSRAFTTLGWARGVAIAFALISIIVISNTPTPNGQKNKNNVYAKKPLSVALVIFSAAFLVNMFESSTHGTLIAIGSLLAILFTTPGCETGIFSACYRKNKSIEVGPCMCNSRPLWFFLWIFMILNCGLFLGFWSESCANGDLPPERCPVLKVIGTLRNIYSFGLCFC